MAEGGDVTSTKDGSDADLVIVCTPCGEGNSRKEAVKYCPDCQEYLCAACTIHHSRLKATRSHKVLDRHAAKQASVIAVTTKCRYHPDRDIEMYCEGHDMVYCVKCIATDHRACSGVTGIEKKKLSSVQQNVVERLQNDIRNIQERLADTDKKTQKNIDCVEEQRDEIFTQIEDVERNLKERIRKLKREAMATLKKKYTSVKKELKSDINLIANMKKEIENASSQFETFTSMDAVQQFVQMKLIRKTVSDAVNLVEDSEATGSKALCFTENTHLKTSVMTATSLGHVNTVTENDPETSQRIYMVKSKKEINIKMQNDMYMCCISDICQLQDGTIILADYNNNKIKRLDMNYNIKDHCDLSYSPRSICCTGQNEVAVKMYNNKVQFISVGSSLSKQREISVAGGGYWGMAYCAGELWISTGSGVNVYSTSGTYVKTIEKGIDGRRIFKGSTGHMAVSRETVIVTDYSDGAVCLERDCTVQRELRDKRLVATNDVCVSSDGTVFLSDYKSNNIVMFDNNGKCLGALVIKHAGLRNPIALHYDDKRKRLIVTCYSSKKIVIFDASAYYCKQFKLPLQHFSNR